MGDVFWQGVQSSLPYFTPYFFRKHMLAGHQWLMPIILATQGAEIRRITVLTQNLEKTHHRKRADGVAQGIVPKFKPQC
jgi:hypothetical protein